jgi:hypothetical protein
MSGAPDRIKIEVTPRDPTPCQGKVGISLRHCFINAAQPQPEYTTFGVVNKITEIDKRLKVYKLEFTMPEGAGLYNELQVNRGGQRSSPVFVHYKPPVVHQVCYQICYTWQKLEINILTKHNLIKQIEDSYIKNQGLPDKNTDSSGQKVEWDYDAAQMFVIKEYIKSRVFEYKTFNNFDIKLSVIVK